MTWAEALGATAELDDLVATAARCLALRAGVDPVDLDHDPWLRDRSDREIPGIGGGEDALGRFHQELQARSERRSSGTFHTPVDVGRTLVDLSVERLGRTPRSIVDPACGGGALLLASAQRLFESGVAPHDAVARLVGIDIDHTAVDVARISLGLWCFRNGGKWQPPPRSSFPAEDPLIGRRFEHRSFDLVVMNPPFQGQLRTGTTHDRARREDLKDRWGEAVGAYTDTAVLFLLLADELAGPRGVVGSIVPRSLLGSRDSERARVDLASRRGLGAVWLDPGPFDGATVTPAAVVLDPIEREADDGGARAVVDAGMVVEGGQRRPLRATGSRWSSAVADLPALPPIESHQTLGDVADVAAGFRDEFYGLLDGVSDDRHGSRSADRRPVVTSGLIDPLSLRWGLRSARIGGQRYERPVLDDTAIAGRAARWAGRQRRPKLLVANQTSVVEAVTDPDGELVGITPVIVVMPQAHEDLGVLAALSCSPLWSALLAREAAGTGLGARTMRLSSGRLSELPVPRRSPELAAAAEHASSLEGSATTADIVELGTRVHRAQGLAPDHPLLDWWVARLPRSLG